MKKPRPELRADADERADQPDVDALTPPKDLFHED
jgi:hypothetical protein